MFDLTSFSHGQIKSKLWLCDKIKEFLPNDANVWILGSWYNVLGCMLFIKHPEKINFVTGIDVDQDAIDTAEKITSYWYIEGKANNICTNANEYTVPGGESNVIINCSPEHFESKLWFDNLPENTIVCIQSSNITDPKEPWIIKQPSASFDDFLNNYPLTHKLYTGIQKIEYSHFSYERYMMIGKK